MTDLTHDAKALIDASRLNYRIRVSDKARIRRKLMHRLSATAAAGSVITTAALSAEAARATAPLVLWASAPSAVKALAMVVLVGATTASGVAMWRAPAHSNVGAPAANATTGSGVQRRDTKPPECNGAGSSAPIPSATAVQRDIAPSATTPSDTAASATTPSDTAASEVDTAPDGIGRAEPNKGSATAKLAVHGDSVARSKVHSAAVASSNGAPFGSATKVSTGDAANRRRTQQNVASDGDMDVRLLAQANAIRGSRAALQRGDAQAALVNLDQSLPPGNAGELEQEALYLRVSAYCQLHKVAQARHFADSFLSRFNGSPLEARVRRSCAFEPPESQ